MLLKWLRSYAGGPILREAKGGESLYSKHAPTSPSAGSREPNNGIDTPPFPSERMGHPCIALRLDVLFDPSALLNRFLTGAALFRRGSVQTRLCSGAALFRRGSVQTRLCSDAALFRRGSDQSRGYRGNASTTPPSTGSVAPVVGVALLAKKTTAFPTWWP